VSLYLTTPIIISIACYFVRSVKIMQKKMNHMTFFPGMLRVTQGCPGMPRDVQECPGMPRDTQGNSEKLRETQKSLGVPRAALETLRDTWGSLGVP
jgi:hypothetical protein